MSRPAGRRLALVALLGAAALPACRSWRAYPPEAAATAKRLDGRATVRVTRTDGATLLVRDARLEADSIVGVSGDSATRTAVAVRDVARVEERRVDGRRTSALVGGIALGYVMVALITVLVVLSGLR